MKKSTSVKIASALLLVSINAHIVGVGRESTAVVSKTRRRLISAANIVILFIAVWGINPGAANAEPVDLAPVEMVVNESATSQVVEFDAIVTEQLVFYPTDGGRKDLGSGFGYRAKSCVACSSDHNGTDFNPGIGKKIYAVSYGTVVKVGWESGYGFAIRIRHDASVGLGNVVTLYAHMIEGSNFVRVGDRVLPRQKIGRVGNTGVTTGPHLHFEVLVSGTQVNPMSWLQEQRAK